eukprot:sb/3464954/
MDPSVSLNEYMEEVEQLEAVVGAASDGSVCTFSEGYKDRQAVFSCLDCVKQESNISAGFCYACSIHCHKNHDVEMLYTKRSFRCDCGTLPQLLCQLKPEVSVRNANNKYNHNFKGLYCSCDLPYPDPSHPELDDSEMIQCVVCEDWFHDVHIGTTVPEPYEEMICGTCIARNPFLSHYALPKPPVLDVGKSPKNEIPADTVTGNGSLKSDETVISSASEKPIERPENVAVPENDSSKTDNSHSDVTKVESNVNENDSTTTEQNPVSSTSAAETSETSEPNAKRKRLNVCKLDSFPATEPEKRAYFFNDQFRGNICKCNKCISLYTEHNITFITKTEDSLQAYEERGSNEREREEDSFNSVIQNLPHAAKCNVARAMGSLKEGIREIVSQISEGKEDLTPDIIRNKFREMAAANNIDPKYFENIGKK